MPKNFFALNNTHYNDINAFIGSWENDCSSTWCITPLGFQFYFRVYYISDFIGKKKFRGVNRNFSRGFILIWHYSEVRGGGWILCQGQGGDLDLIAPLLPQALNAPLKKFDFIYCKNEAKSSLFYLRCTIQYNKIYQQYMKYKNTIYNSK